MNQAPTDPPARRGEPGLPARGALIAASSLALSTGFLDIALNLRHRGPPAFWPFPALLPPLAAATCAMFVIVGASFLCGSLVRRLLPVLEGSALICSLTLFWGLSFIFASLGGLVTLDPSRMSALPAFLVLSLSAVLAGNGYSLAKASAGVPGRRAAAKTLALTAPFLCAGTLLWEWTRVYRARPFPSGSAPLLLAGFLVIAAAGVRLAVRLVHRISLVRWLGAAMLVVVLSPLFTLAPGRSSPRASGHRIRRVVLICIDTLRADAVSALGAGAEKTPNLDALAREALVFTNAVSPAPWTLPAMASILTGTSPAVHGARSPFDSLDEALPTLAERLEHAGYLTAAIGHNPFFRRKFGFSQGFHEYDVSPRLHLGSSFGSKILRRLLPLHFAETAGTEDLTRLAIEWLHRNRERDFFLWLHYYDPHDPYSPPARYQPPTEPPSGLGRQFSRAQDIRSGNFVPSSAQRAWSRELYEGEVRYVDENVGKLIGALRELALYEDALIILVSDHGEEFWEHGGYEHGHTLYSEVIRVPWLVKLPGAARKGPIAETVSTGSVTPLVLDLCGIAYDPEALTFRAPPPFRDGQAGGPGSEPVGSTALLYFEDRQAIDFDGMRYIRWLMSGREELYDLARDPGERSSIVASSPAQIRKARNLLAGMEASSRALRRRYGLPEDHETEPDRNRGEELRSLGYVN